MFKKNEFSPINKKMQRFVIVGGVIGLIFGLFFGAIVGINPLISMILGGLLGLRIGYKAYPKMGAKKVVDIHSKSKKELMWQGGAILLFLIIALYFFRPWFHDFLITFYIVPSILFMIGCVILSPLFFKKKQPIIGMILLLVALLSLIIVMFNPILVQRHIVSNNDYNSISTLPDSTDVRLLPKAVAWRYLEDSLQKSREKVGGLDIVNVDNKLAWTSSRIPDGSILFFTEPVKGLMISDATKTDRSTRLISKDLHVGEGIGITDNIYWKLYKKEFFMNIDEVYYITDGDDVLTVAPLIRYKFKFPVMVPYFSGVYILRNDEITRYSKDEIQNLEIFANNWVFPESLARLYVDSYKYNLGVLNTWFFHEDQIEISDVYGQENRQPFLMPTAEGLKWIVATEPWGESYGVFKIFLVDAKTGKIDMVELNEDQTLTGPVRVVDYVKQRFPRIDWSTQRVVEPRPYIIKGKLFWMLSITPRDFAGVSFTVLINSENNEVISFDEDEDVYRYIKQGITEETMEEEDKQSDIRDRIADLEDLVAELKELVNEE